MIGAVFGYRSAVSDEGHARRWIAGIDFDSFLLRYAQPPEKIESDFILPFGIEIVADKEWIKQWVQNTEPVRAMRLSEEHFTR